MSLSSERASIEALFFANWNTNTTPVRVDNIAGLIKGNQRIMEEDSLTEWCWLSIIPGPADVADMGSSTPRVRYTGMIYVNIFVKEGTGTDRARQIADLAADVFQLQHFDGIRTHVANVVNTGQAKTNGLYQITVKFPYVRDEIVNIG